MCWNYWVCASLGRVVRVRGWPLQDKLQQNEDALGAAQEDLARDELIFAERVKEIKRLRRALQVLAHSRTVEVAGPSDPKHTHVTIPPKP